jgi:hypothetical protein
LLGDDVLRVGIVVAADAHERAVDEQILLGFASLARVAVEPDPEEQELIVADLGPRRRAS